ncbi:MAG TPA: hypothetical protein VGW10_17620 [Solirubrobacteraceae bacterium]|nr:hypothetical protein [Solirubrobacteraceae bacterium]
MSRPLVLLVVLTTLAAGVAEASAAFTIRTKEGAIRRIGPMKTVGADGGRLMDATAVFGPATRIAPIGDSGSEACRVDWTELKLRTTFVNFGGADPCGAETGRLQVATIRSRRFRTARDLRVGDPSSTIKEKYPKAEFKRNVWVVMTTEYPLGADPGPIPTIEAIVKKGRIEVLRLWVGAGGD